jgi:ATP-dependent Clp protease adaptor protein ClpS
MKAVAVHPIPESSPEPASSTTMVLPLLAYPYQDALSASRQSQMAQNGGQNEGEGEDQQQKGTSVLEDRPDLQPPKQYRVYLVNDDYTPMKFVEVVLQMFFGMTQEVAYRVMMHVHTRGKGVCGTYSKEIAETKVAQVNHFAQSHQHPLKCAMEEA